ncbi:hypothetical protein DM01DRAFT_1269006, partial [Hesseltinella vesiculosa]
LIIRSATRWAEQGERSSKYFYRCIKERNRMQTIRALKTPESSSATETKDILRTARNFYQNLYSPSRTIWHMEGDLLSAIPE